MVLNLLNRLFGSSIDALPNSSVAVEEKKKDGRREEKYGSDIEALKQKCSVEFKSGLCIIPTHCKFKVQLQMRKIDFDRVDELLFAGCVIKSENKKRELPENG